MEEKIRKLFEKKCENYENQKNLIINENNEIYNNIIYSLKNNISFFINDKNNNLIKNTFYSSEIEYSLYIQHLLLNNNFNNIIIKESDIYDLYISLYCTNQMKKYIPNFEFVFGGYLYNKNYRLIIEKYNGINLNKFIENITFDILLEIIMQVILSLMMINEKYNFKHYNCICDNINIIILDDYININYNDYYLQTKYLVKIQNFNQSFFQENNKKYGFINLNKFLNFYEEKNINDVQTFIIDLYLKLYNLNKLDLCQELNKIFNYTIEEYFLLNQYKEYTETELDFYNIISKIQSLYKENINIFYNNICNNNLYLYSYSQANIIKQLENSIYDDQKNIFLYFQSIIKNKKNKTIINLKHLLLYADLNKDDIYKELITLFNTTVQQIKNMFDKFNICIYSEIPKLYQETSFFKKIYTNYVYQFFKIWNKIYYLGIIEYMLNEYFLFIPNNNKKIILDPDIKNIIDIINYCFSDIKKIASFY